MADVAPPPPYVPPAKRPRPLEPEKSPSDKNSYRLLVFPSGFEALLVSSADVKKSRAACAVAVGAGSFNDPPKCQGLAHFLEHMLFMGSEKYPGEDEMESFLSKNGGSSNAFTDCTHTCYYFEVDKAGLHTGLDMLAQFFVAPLLKTNSAERELQAIESEFRLTQNSDDSRLEALLGSFAKPGHPFRKFGWGNLQSLQEEPKRRKVDVYGELLRFFALHYQASALRLCVFGVESLDSLESAVRRSFAELEAATVPRQPKEDPPFEDTLLPALLRVRPVQDLQKLSLSWQLPRSQHLYLTSPLCYLGHLVGHEGAGSLQSFLKAEGLATEVEAGVGEDDFANNYLCTIFNIEITLTQKGLTVWPEVAHCGFLYLSMLKTQGPQQWVFDELRRAQDMSWRFLEETDPVEYVQKLACQMLPDLGRAPEHILKGDWMLSRWDPEAISQFLGRLAPEKCFLALVSSSFGQAQSSKAEGEEGEEEEPRETDPELDTAKDPCFDLEAAGPPQRAAYFGTEYWRAEKEEVLTLLERWQGSCSGLAADAAAYLRLPDRNPFFAEDFGLKDPSGASKPPSLEEWLPQGSSAPPGFPAPVPRPAALAAAVPAWHLQETVLRLPRSEVWVKLSASSTQSCEASALMAWLARVITDSLNETVYLAEQASLELRVQEEFYGLDLRIGGFHDKLPQLLAHGLQAVRSCAETLRGGAKEFERRALAQKEELLRGWRNEYMKPEDHCADLRRALVMPHKFLSLSRAEALQDVTLAKLADFAEAQVPALELEALCQGNCTAEEARGLVDSLPALLGRDTSTPSASSAHAAHPAVKVVEIPSGQPVVWVQDSLDPGNRNVALEMYWQLGLSQDEAKDTAQVELLSELLSEPLFDQLRTKQQLGYVVSCGSRWTHRVQGFSVWIQSCKFPPAELCKRVDAFLETFQRMLAEMSDEDFRRQKEALAAAKLEPERSLQGMQQAAWAELQERSHCFDRHWQEALVLHRLPKASAAELLTRLLDASRRLVITAAVGGRAKCCSSAAAAAAELQELYPTSRLVSSRDDFLRTAGVIDT